MRGTILLLFLCIAPEVHAQDLDKLKFLAGCYGATTGRDQTVEEIWTRPAPNMLSGLTRYFTRREATGWDFNLIEKTDSTVHLVIMSKGEPPDTFRLRTLADEVVIFENVRNEYPRRVMYRLTSRGAIIARLEGDPAAGETDLEVALEPMKCPSR